MEARALKSSFLSETAMKSTQQVFFDDWWCVSGINNVNCDDFSVDDLLDFSDKDFKESFLEESEEDEEKDSLSVSSQDRGVDDDNNSSNSITSQGSGVFGSLPAGELAVPIDEMENLEWLSQFVDDSVSGVSLLCPAGNSKEKTGKCAGDVVEPESKKFTVLGLQYPVRTKARTKRSRPSGRVWSIGLLLLTQSFSTSLSKSSSQDSSAESFSSFQKQPAKKQKRNPAMETGSHSSGTQTIRRCSHCLVQKTPQWRTGPLGPKTLCNACGVRFKSGRLFPEYRPACSPTFSVDVHSNSHRKVLEMRRKNQTVEFAEPGFTPMVQSF